VPAPALGDVPVTVSVLPWPLSVRTTEGLMSPAARFTQSQASLPPLSGSSALRVYNASGPSRHFGDKKTPPAPRPRLSRGRWRQGSNSYDSRGLQHRVCCRPPVRNASVQSTSAGSSFAWPHSAMVLCSRPEPTPEGHSRQRRPRRRPAGCLPPWTMCLPDQHRCLQRSGRSAHSVELGPLERSILISVPSTVRCPWPTYCRYIG
jgi:hypothetical protein